LTQTTLEILNGETAEEMIPIKPKLKFRVFKTPLFTNEVKKYFEKVFPEVFERYGTTPAKGGTKFIEIPDMSYPLHILNGILPSILFLEQKMLQNESLSELVRNEDPDIKMLVYCTLIGITFHDINKLVGKQDILESLDNLDQVLTELGLELSEEEKGIIKYLIVGTEDRTRYSTEDKDLPKRRNLERVIKDYLLEAVHLADSISIPPEETFSDTFRLLQRKLKNYFREVHTFYFHESPYEVLSRYILVKLISRIEGKPILISPKGFIWIGKQLNIAEIEGILQDIEMEYQNLLIEQLDDFIACDWQKAQLDIFRYMTPTKDFVKEKLISVLLERKKELILYRGLPSDEEEKENIKKEIEKLETQGKLEIMVVFKLLFTTANNKYAKRLKIKKEEKYYPEVKEEVKNIKGPVLRNVKKVITATHKFDGNKDELYDDLVDLLTENYKDETIDIKEVFKTVLGYACLDGKPVFEIRIQDVGDKQQICSICGAETNIVAKEGVAFGFTARGFTNRTVVSTKNTERKICKNCLVEIMLRKLIFNVRKNSYAVYIDACDYTVPIINAGRVMEKIEEQINGIRLLSGNIFNYYRIVYGYPFKDSKDVLFPFLMAHLQTGKESDFLQRFYELLVFANNTGFKVYLSYAMNPDRIKKETFVLDYAPKPIKKLKWDRIRIDELHWVKEEFEILRNLAKAIGGRRWQNEFVRVLNDYSDFPLAFFYYLYRLDKPSSFINKNQKKIERIYERIGDENMGAIEELADKASEIEWSGYTTSKQTRIIRTAIDALKIGVQRELDKEDTIALMAGMINRKIKYQKVDEIENFCKEVYNSLYEKTWKKKIPSKSELKYWIYGFAFEYTKKSEEKSEKMKKEKQKEGGEKDE